jgi:hypothetical protein
LQVALCVVPTTLVVMAFVYLFPHPESASGRGILAAIALRVSLFFGMLKQADGTPP